MYRCTDIIHCKYCLFYLEYMRKTPKQSNKFSEPIIDYMRRFDHHYENYEAEQVSIRTRAEEITKKYLLQNRINKAMRQHKYSHKAKIVSAGEAFKTKKWVSPLEPCISSVLLKDVLLEQSNNTQQDTVKATSPVSKQPNVYFINQHLKYFGEYLEAVVEKKIQNVVKHSHKSLQIKYLQERFQQLKKNQRKKICILSSEKQTKMTFLNYFENDIYYKSLIKQNDFELTYLFHRALVPDSHFTISSLSLFYDIFVWQTANAQTQIQFACRVLMDLREEILITIFCSQIQFIMSKLQNQKSLNTTLIKLLLQHHYSKRDQKDYYISKKDITRNLRNHFQIVCIVINTFYAIQ